ncbi:hypothetical protein, variant [Aphanomyces astaci]|uniref:Uncharacterized protein n=1 Tax=Aphanomyces astaci TaxID=112090 RepID=W4GSX5_APHAT|nr:hypothetical protein, variant [Aphanomyces astaci]ETV82064.1 hypothetical protein, variant [Aphanomyces astaci]|eukprot:XP_009828801.1 hypothetical protein, variant [Aphanomyces astaci]
MLLQRVWRRSSAPSTARRLGAHYSSHGKKRQLDALKGHGATVAQVNAFNGTRDPAPSSLIAHHLANNDVSAATTLLLQQGTRQPSRDDRIYVGLALRQALETDTSLIPSLVSLAVSSHAEVPSDVFDACVHHCRDHSLSKLATSLAHVVHNDLTPLPLSPLDFVTVLIECGANRAAVTFFLKLQELRFVHTLPTHVIHMLTCLQCVYDGVTPRTNTMDIQTDAASIVRYFHYDHKIVAKSILNIFKRHMKATPPSSLLHQLAADLELVRQDVVPLLQYAVVDRGLAMEPHVYLSWLQTAPMESAAPVLLQCLPSIFQNRLDHDESMEIVRTGVRQCFRQGRVALGLALSNTAKSYYEEHSEIDTDIGLTWVTSALEAIRTDVSATDVATADESAIVALYLHPRVSTEVATAMAHLLGHLPNALSKSFETSGLFRKLARALCFNGHVELASSVFAWLEDIHEMLVPLELWTLFFSKTKRPIDHVLLEYEQNSCSAKQVLRPAFDRFIAHLEHLNATSAPATDSQLDEAVVAAMKAALHVGDMDTALAIQTTTSWVSTNVKHDGLAVVLAAARVIPDRHIQRNVALYFLEQPPSTTEEDQPVTWPSTASIFEILVANRIHMGRGVYRKMLRQVVPDLDMVTAHALLHHAQQHSIEVSPNVFAVRDCYFEEIYIYIYIRWGLFDWVFFVSHGDGYYYYYY